MCLWFYCSRYLSGSGDRNGGRASRTKKKEDDDMVDGNGKNKEDEDMADDYEKENLPLREE